MARRTAQGTDRTSQAFMDAQSVMGSSAPTNAKAQSQAGNPDSALGVHSIDVEPAANGGVTVSHRMKMPKAKNNPYEESGRRTTNVFSTPQEAHSHIGTLLGVAAHSPHAGGGKGGGALG